MQRLFTSFAGGWAGAGLLLLRLLAASGLIHGGIDWLRFPSSPTGALSVVLAATGLLLVIGLYTPLVGVAAALAETYVAFFHAVDPWVHLGLAGLGLSVAMIGPGAWSVDARLFGRKQMDLSKLSNESVPPPKW